MATVSSQIVLDTFSLFKPWIINPMVIRNGIKDIDHIFLTHTLHFTNVGDD